MTRLQKNSFKRNFIISEAEIHYIIRRKMIPVPVYLQNGQNFYTYNESYTPCSELLANCLKYLKVPQDKHHYFCLYEGVSKTSKYEERQLPEPLLVGDLLSSWEIMKKHYQDLISYTRVYVGLKYFPLEPEPLLFPMVCSKLFDIYYSKIYLEKYESVKIWGLAFQLYFGDYTERPGFLRDKARLFYHKNFQKFYNDESFIKDLKENYEALSGRSKESCAMEILQIDEMGGHLNSQVFKVMFRNSNNPNFRDMQEHVIMTINSQCIALAEESSRENILEIGLEEVANWGVNNDILVISYGDKYEITKMYFLSHAPTDIAEALFNYTNQNKQSSPGNFYDENPEISKFLQNSKTRKTNTFTLK